MDGFTAIPSQIANAQGKEQMTFDWDKAAKIINKALKTDPNLTAEAGLEGDWAYTGGTIYENNKPVKYSYTFLSSNWATPTLIISSNGVDTSYECYTTKKSRFGSGSKWDKKSLAILKANQ